VVLGTIVSCCIERAMIGRINKTKCKLTKKFQLKFGKAGVNAAVLWKTPQPCEKRCQRQVSAYRVFATNHSEQSVRRTISQTAITVAPGADLKFAAQGYDQTEPASNRRECMRAGEASNPNFHTAG
jgi:hypothetical protein